MITDTLTKKDIARVLVRFLGVYFAFLIVWRIGNILSDIFFFTAIGSEINYQEKFTLSAFAPLIPSLLMHLCLSFYCIKKGNWLIEFISRSGSAESKRAESAND